MTEIIAISFAACLANNLILDGMLGIAPALAASKKIDVATGMGITMIFVLSITALVSHLLKTYLLFPLDLQHLTLISFVIIISTVVLLSLKILKKRKPDLCEEINLFIPLSLMNTAVLGTALLNVEHNHGLFGSLFFGLSSGLGFALILVMIAAIQDRISVADVPAPFRGVSITLITIGILAMAFMGFIGLGS